MANPILPKGLKPIQAGYGYDDPDGAMATEVAGGGARYALRYRGGPQRFTVTIALKTQTLRAIWSLFFHRVIALGTIKFDMPLDSGFGVETHTVNIAPKSLTETLVAGKLWSVKFTAVATPKAYQYSDAEVTLMLQLHDVVPDDLEALLDRLEQWALVDTLKTDAL